MPPLPAGKTVSRGGLRVPVLGTLLMGMGVLLLWAAAHLEASWLASQPWTDAYVVLDGDSTEAAAETSVPLRARRIERDYVGEVPVEVMFAAWIEQGELGVQFDTASRLFVLEVEDTELEGLLKAGRLPNPGEREVLAGPLASDAPFTIDGAAFTVVGRLRASLACFTNHYVTPDSARLSAFFGEDAGTETGQVYRQALADDGQAASASTAEEQDAELSSFEARHVAPQIQAQSHCTHMVYWGLILVAAGGALVHVGLFRWLAPRRLWVLGPAIRALSRRWGLFLAMHVALYGVFFGAMAAGMQNPLINFHLTRLLSSVFMEGGLSYIGEAYASGRVFYAAGATFMNNYVVQTLGFTFGASLLVPLGILKTAASMALVGFAMAPLWVGSAAGYTYHCVTMVLELEAYIAASTIVALWFWGCIMAVGEGPFFRRMLRNVAMLGSAALLTGLMLALAALYEAATIILLG